MHGFDPVSTKIQCCFIHPETGGHCGAPAAYEMHFSRDPMDFTHACEIHVGEMLTDAPEQHVYRIGLGEKVA